MKTQKTLSLLSAALLTGALLLLAECEKKLEEKVPFEHWDVTKTIRCHDVDIDSTITSVTDHATTWIALMKRLGYRFENTY